MRKIIYTILTLSILSIYAYCGSVALSEVPDEAIAFADKYFADYYLFRATEMGGSYTLIFKGGLKIYVNSYGEWRNVSGGGEEISIAYVEDKVQSAIKKEFPDEKVVNIQKNRKNYSIEFKSRKKIVVDFEGNITKKGRG
ncbi:PepSY-like domain-containing protein [Brachyspira hyodysenteriae]|uniref:PepSY-like domain-containing protein n=1 Tax=Brachyspira hyodysenteriae TaxID=159 RepID=UPI0022CD797C|nr:PepSY-like domain-containing protein [Brachyspira hyodysenteriae]MCZ9838445.1 PepSY-like domain-containing protein [Brachyspira hyodysenteriae]MCZ9849558.1 PepSY-like domain-containing protein [Brachyspira hyodysenteriae]MCZ9873558.1 PepSY-like domain-containing protein [Brachyspira hyodysenteriae]MCZ9892471.1 PepSY-like domain-containing protein [Brachyspira hyodysenteriae]MCZ9931244.1 PepSY-like domain-containing protein [Brachyspira hyodysenteriae]